jgi:hypothetical protein
MKARWGTGAVLVLLALAGVARADKPEDIAAL